MYSHHVRACAKKKKKASKELVPAKVAAYPEPPGELLLSELASRMAGAPRSGTPSRR